MNKNETLEAILSAKKAHLDRMNRINARLNGKSEEELTMISKKECAFGAWFYSDDRLKSMLGTQFYDNLANIHLRWHLEYRKLYELFCESENKKGVFSKLIGRQKVSQMVLDKAKLYYTDLEITTNELVKAIDVSYRRLNALNESYFT